MLFNPDSSAPAQEFLFSRKTKAQIHPIISLNNIQVKRASYHELLGILVDENFDLKHHVDSGMLEVNKIFLVKDIFVIKKVFFQKKCFLIQKPLVTVYEAYLRPQLDH